MCFPAASAVVSFTWSRSCSSIPLAFGWGQFQVLHCWVLVQSLDTFTSVSWPFQVFVVSEGLQDLKSTWVASSACVLWGLCRVSSSQTGNETIPEQCQVLRLSWHQRSYGSFGCFRSVGTELLPTLLVFPPTLQWLLMACCSRSWELNALLTLCHGKQSLPPVPVSVLQSAPATITLFVTEKAVSLFYSMK